jgi:dihydrofolate reductase
MPLYAEHRIPRDDSHGGEPRRLHRPKGRPRRLDGDVRRVRGRRRDGPCVHRGVPEDDRLLRDGIAHVRDRAQLRGQGVRWAYGDKPVFVLTSRNLPKTRDTIEFHAGDLAAFVNDRLRPAFRNIWFVGGGAVSGECVRLGLADELRYSILPILIGQGISFFDSLDKDVALHLAEVNAYKNGIVDLRYEVRR